MAAKERMSEQQSIDPTGPTYLTDLSTTAAMESARASAYAGDATAGKAGQDFANVIGTRALHLRTAIARHDALVADDLMPEAGKARLIEENARTLAALDYSTGEIAENASLMQEISLRASLLAHNESNDVAIRAKVNNYLANLSGSEAQSAVIQLAGVTEFSTFMAGSEGQSLASRYGVDHAALTRAAIQNLTANGNQTQRKLGEALAVAPGKAYRAKMLSKANYVEAVAKFRLANQKAVGRGFEGPDGTPPAPRGRK
jgi:hypothetical protein